VTDVRAGRRAPAGLPVAIEGFLGAIRRAGRAEATIRNYRADLAALAKAAKRRAGRRPLDQVVREHLARLDIAQRSWNRHLSTLRCFCAYLVANGALAANPLASVSGRRAVQPAPRALHGRQIERLFERIDRPRDRALVRLLWDCGLRVGEALRLELSDVDLRAGTIAINDGDRARAVRLTAATKRALQEYLHERRSTKTNLVFVANGGRQLSYAAAHRLFRSYAGNSELTMQRLRAGAATAAFVAGASLEQVQDMMGHRHAASTARYGTSHSTSFAKGELRK